MDSVGAVFVRETTGPGRRNAFLRAVGFFALIFVVGSLIALVLKETDILPDNLAVRLTIVEWLMVAVIVAAAAAMAPFSGRRFSVYGLGGKGRIRNFVVGFIAGLVLLAGMLAVLWSMGNLTLGTITATPLALIGAGLFYALMFLGVAMSEETLFRGYGFVELSRAVSFWPAVLIVSLVFGAVHLGNGGNETYFGALATALLSIVFAISFRLTGSLWLAIGLHFGWNYAQSFVFGVPDSGLSFEGSLLHVTANGPDWLTGGSVGPEGSVLLLGPLLLIPALSWLLRQRADAT